MITNARHGICKEISPPSLRIEKYKTIERFCVAKLSPRLLCALPFLPSCSVAHQKHSGTFVTLRPCTACTIKKCHDRSLVGVTQKIERTSVLGTSAHHLTQHTDAYCVQALNARMPAARCGRVKSLRRLFGCAASGGWVVVFVSR